MILIWASEDTCTVLSLFHEQLEEEKKYYKKLSCQQRAKWVAQTHACTCIPDFTIEWKQNVL